MLGWMNIGTGQIGWTMRMVRLQRARVLGLVVLGVVLAGCGTMHAAVPHPHHHRAGALAASSGQAQPRPTTPHSEPAPAVRVINPSTIPGCQPANLAVRLVSAVRGAGTMIRAYAFINQGASTCSLIGYAGVTLLDAQQSALATNQVDVTDQENLVILPPKGQAWFVLQYPDSPRRATAGCPASSALAIVPPGTNQAIIVKGSAGRVAESGPACGQVEVQPVTPRGVPLKP